LQIIWRAFVIPLLLFKFAQGRAELIVGVCSIDWLWLWL